METLDDLVGVIFCYEIRLIFRRVNSAKYEVNCTILSLLLGYQKQPAHKHAETFSPHECCQLTLLSYVLLDRLTFHKGLG